MEEIQPPQPSFELEDAVDLQLEALERSINEKGFKPTEGLTQGYVESQRIFSRVAVTILSFVSAIQQENNGDTVSTEDNLMRVSKMLATFSQPWRAQSITGQVEEVERLVASSRVRNGLYSLAYEGHVGKSLVWCVASLVRVLFVADFYGMRTPPFDTLQEFVDVGKAVLEEDFAALRFNYGKYERDSSRPRFSRPITDEDKAAAGVNGPMDAFVGVQNTRRRPVTLQEYVDMVTTTQDTLSAIVPRGKYKNENVAVSVASAYDRVDGEGEPLRPMAPHVLSLRSATAALTPASEYNHNSPYERARLFFNTPRNVRGPSIFQAGHRVNGKYVSELVTRLTEASYTEDVAAATVGLSFLALENDSYISMGTGASLSARVNEDGLILPAEVHVDELVFLSIVRDGGGMAVNRVSSNGEPLLEDSVTNSLLNCSLRVSLGLPVGDDGDLLSPEAIAFYVCLYPPAYGDGGLVKDFFHKVVLFSLTVNEATERVADDSVFLTDTDYRIPLTLFHGHLPDEGMPTAEVSVDSPALRTIGNSLLLPGGRRLVPEAYRNIAINFMQNIGKFQEFTK